MENIAPNRGPRERLRKEAAPRDIPPRTVEAARNADHYTQLGVTRDAAPAEIRRAYHRLVFAHHPDKVDRAAVQSLSSSSFSVSSSSSSSSSTTTAAAATTTTTPTHNGTLRKSGGDDGLDGLSFPCNIDIDTDEDDVDVDATAITEDKDLERDSSNNHATANAVPRSPTSPCANADTADYHSTMFSLITDAYNVLHDGVLRAEYDLAQGFVEKSDANMAALHTQQRDQALEDIELMQVTYESRRATEDECRGVVVVSAVYGALQNYVNTRHSIAKSALGPTLDVTVQVQCAIEASTLYVEGGMSKVAALRGVFNPCAVEERLGAGGEGRLRAGMNRASSTSNSISRAFDGSNSPRLCVRYLFRGKQHQASVGDCEELKIPMRSHQLAASQQFKIRRRKKKSRRNKKRTLAAHRTEQTADETSTIPVRTCDKAVVVAAGAQGVPETNDASASSASPSISTVIQSESEDKIDGKGCHGLDADSKEKSGGGGSLSFVLVLAAAMVVGVYYSRATR